jgi:hypothetical protein
MDCHYTLLEEAEVQKILHNLRPGKKQTHGGAGALLGLHGAALPAAERQHDLPALRATGLSRDEAIEAIVSTEEIAESVRRRCRSSP